eukprot:s953_g15.t1
MGVDGHRDEYSSDSSVLRERRATRQEEQVETEEREERQRERERVRERQEREGQAFKTRPRGECVKPNSSILLL